MSSDERTLVRYLLGDLAEDERHRIEEEYFASDERYDELMSAERDLMDRYVGGELHERERQQFEAFFLQSPGRAEKLEFSRALAKRYSKAPDHFSSAERDSPHPAVFAGSGSSLNLRFAILAILILAGGVVVWRLFFDRPELKQGVEALRMAYSSRRPVESRVSLLDYAPYEVTRGGADDPVDESSRRRAEFLLSEAASESPDSNTHHALAVTYLSNREFDKAFAEFEAAIAGGRAPARVYADFGAALFEKARLDQDAARHGQAAEGFARSAEMLNKALDLDGSLREALFNIALLHEIDLPAQAEQDWGRYLEKDSTSKWADEAREHLKRLEESRKTSRTIDEVMQEYLEAFRAGDDQRAWSAIRQNREPITGRLIHWQLLESILADERKGRLDKATALRALAFAGRLEKGTTGDGYVADLAMFYVGASVEQTSLMAKGHRSINKGHRRCLKSRYGKAGELYRRASQYFKEAGDELEAEYANYWIGYCVLQDPGRNRDENAKTIFEELSSEFALKNYHWLRGLAVTSLANAEFRDSEYSSAIDSTMKALDTAARLEDPYGTQKSLAQLADMYRSVGNNHQSLIYTRRCLESANRDWPGRRQMWRTCDSTAQLMVSQGWFDAAADYEREALRLAMDESDPALIYVSLVHLGTIYGELNRFQEGLSLAARGYAAAQEASNNNRTTAYCNLMLGNLSRRAGDYESAMTYYDRAREYYSAVDHPAQIYNVHKGSFSCFLERGDYTRAGEELQIVLDLLRQHRARIREETNRNAFLEAEQSLYDDAIKFAYSTGDHETAFEYSELARGRSLLDLLKTEFRYNGDSENPEIDFPSDSQPLKMWEIGKRLPGGAQILQYDALDDRLIIWLVSEAGLEVREQPVPAAEVERRVGAYLKTLSKLSEIEEVKEQARELFQLLIGPVEALLDPAKQLCIVPDESLNLLPFSSLVGGNEYLVNEFVLSFSPSATVFIEQCEKARGFEGVKQERILSVGNPALDLKQFPSLPRLPESADEARELAAFYRATPPTILVETEATESRVRMEMPAHDVIHLASHYDTDKRSSMHSKLLLANEATGNGRDADGILQAHEVYAMRLKRPRLVVLSACQTGVEAYFDGEGMIGMSRTFVASGVPLVVASLWPVDSSATRELMVSFHGHRRTLPTAQALQRAQQEMASRKGKQYEHPHYWASFELFGGYAGF